ncbi:MAG: Rrf2 family transcriptional regulator [Ignavibacteriales bacterium]|nr:Rrf2 family transcriptional regulator [Ignavibacteriales bacterium]
MEYSLIALRHFSNSNNEIIRVRDISEKYKYPSRFARKNFAEIEKENILESVQGVNGGYRLLRKLSEIPLMDLFNFIETNTSIVECMHDEVQ